MSRQDERIYVGSAVHKGKFRFLSVSAIKLFDPSSEGCHRKWWFQYIAGKRLAKTDALKKGAEYAEKLEHYLKTNEDVLPPVLQPAKGLLPFPGPDLEVEKPLGPNYPLAVFLRDHLLQPQYANREDIKQEIKRQAGLVVFDIPFDGAPDIRHFRDWYMSDDGIPCREIPGTRVIKIDDLKAISRIWPHKIMKGENAGKILPGYAKTSAQVCDDVQMLGYARRDCDVFPDATHFRLGHIYAQTSSRGATRRSGIISREQVLRRWNRVENIVKDMTQVATATKVEDVQPTPSSCDSYTHVIPCGAPGCGQGCYPGSVKNKTTGKYDSCPVCKGKGKTAKGCGHRYYCPLSDSVMVQNMIVPYKESAMSLFNTLPPGAMPSLDGSTPAPPAPSAPVAQSAPPPPPAVANDRAAIEAEKQKLLAQDKARADTKTVKMGCGAPGCGVGCTPGWIKTQPDAQGGGFVICSECKGKGGISIVVPADREVDASLPGTVVVPPAPSPPPVMPASPMAVTPPDAPPPPPLLRAADPVPPDEAAKITNPILQQTVMQHAQQHAQMTATEEAEVERQKQATGTSVWCKWSEQPVKITIAQALTKKFTCECTKVFSTKEAVGQPDGSAVLTLKRHKPKNKDAVPATPAAPAPGAPTEADEDAMDDDETPSQTFVQPTPPPPPTPVVTPPPPPVGEMTQMVNGMFGANGANGTNGHVAPVSQPVVVPPPPPPAAASEIQFKLNAQPTPQLLTLFVELVQTLKSIDYTLKQMVQK